MNYFEAFDECRTPFELVKVAFRAIQMLENPQKVVCMYEVCLVGRL